MKRKIGITLLFFLILGGCSRIKSFSWIIIEVNESFIIVDCIDEMNDTQENWGYACPVQLTEKTI